MKRYVAILVAASMMFVGCTSDSSSSGKRGMTNMETGAIIGAVGGAVVGAVIVLLVYGMVAGRQRTI